MNGYGKSLTKLGYAVCWLANCGATFFIAVRSYNILIFGMTSEAGIKVPVNKLHFQNGSGRESVSPSNRSLHSRMSAAKELACVELQQNLAICHDFFQIFL